jgi:hypothetical protein
MKEIKLQVDLENPEATDSPWWIIIDPRQNFKTDNQSIHYIASMLTGPFFSRQEGEDHLTARRHAFSINARVYCCSGYQSLQYKEACREAKKEIKS